jgi:hypothetical protein
MRVCKEMSRRGVHGLFRLEVAIAAPNTVGRGHVGVSLDFVTKRLCSNPQCGTMVDARRTMTPDLKVGALRT